MTARPMRSGVLLVDKPIGMTSHDVVGKVRRIFGQREVGHTGTLDPMASGLLVLTLGRATRLGRFIEATQKSYSARVLLGAATDTYDADGTVTERAPIPALDAAAVEAACSQFRGLIEQRVPAFSAVRVDGQRLYERARRGEAVEAPSRQVEIFELRASLVEPGTLELAAKVSKGTYIRSLGVDLAKALGTLGHLVALRRHQVGHFRIEDATPLDALSPETTLCDLVSALPDLPRVPLDPEAVRDVCHGRPLLGHQLAAAERFESGDALRLVDPDGALIAIAHALAGAQQITSAPTERAVAYACVLAAQTR